MSWSTNNISSTAKIEAATNSLWNKSRKMCKQALAWRLLKDLEERRVGTNEIERKALVRSWQREAKKGMLEDFKEFGRKWESRDEKYVCGLLSLRSEQAKEDWLEAKRGQRKEKEALVKMAEGTSKKNWVRRELKRMVDHYSRVYERSREKHEQKVEWLVSKYKKRERNIATKREREKEKEEREEWIREMAKGHGDHILKEEQVPVYGEVNLDEDETAFARLPPKYITYPKIEEDTVQYERLLCNTKIRWSRKTTGNLEEQRDAAREREEEKESEKSKMEREIREESSREIYDPERKCLDFRKLRVTDMVNNPRVELPHPRPQRKERIMGAKETLWEETVLEYKEKHCSEKGVQRTNNLE